MADEIAELRMRVEAARDRLSTDAAYARKVELRLDDLVRIVEGSLARQGAELAAAEARVGDLTLDLERALARAEQAMGEAARADRLATENGELKQMVMTLLEVIEGRQKSPLGAVMQKLEENVATLVETAVAAEAAEKTDSVGEVATPETDMVAKASTAAEPEVTLETSDPSAMEDLSEIALYDATAEVVEPDTPMPEKSSG